MNITGKRSKLLIDSQTNAFVAARAALEKQAEDVVVLDVRALSTITDYFVIATADSSRQIAALQSHIKEMVKKAGGQVLHTEGGSPRPKRKSGLSNSKSGQYLGLTEDLAWVLMDCGETIVHLFDERARSFYRLEQLWADAPRIPVREQEGELSGLSSVRRSGKAKKQTSAK